MVARAFGTPHVAFLTIGFLSELLVLLAVATAGVALFERLKLPAIAGFLVMGALVGPGGIGLIGDPERVRELADLGVVFLLFEIGLELPLGRLRLLWRPAMISGGLQVGGTLAVVSVAATQVCLRGVEPESIFAAIAEHGVTTFCGAPVVLNMLLHAPEASRRPFNHQCEAFTGGAAPPSTVIEGMERLGFSVTQLYGLTECYGPSMICAWQDDWTDLDLEARSAKMARQGVKYLTLAEAMVADPETMDELPWDGESIGELMLGGNTVMKGYLKNPEATAEALRGGWFHTGDLGVRHADGYIEIKDRSKDIIISGGENISSIEIEASLYHHPKVLEVAVVAKPDKKWGEVPCAFITLKQDLKSDANEMIDFCRENMARFKVPKTIVFGPLPKTETGKIQKFMLRERAKDFE